MQAVLLYWFARQKRGFFYAKFSAEINEISLFC